MTNKIRNFASDFRRRKTLVDIPNRRSLKINFYIMKQQLSIKGEALNASQAGMLEVEQFLVENYLFRSNVLNGKVEFANKSKEGEAGEFRTLTQPALNSIILRAKREDVCDQWPVQKENQLQVQEVMK